MPGPAPKPTALKLLAGNPGKRKLNTQEPKPLIGAVPPAYVLSDPCLLVEWKLEAPRLTRLGVLTEIDGDILGRICVLRMKFRDALAVGASGLDISKELRALELQFGMGAANRSRVKVEKPPPESKLSRWVK